MLHAVECRGPEITLTGVEACIAFSVFTQLHFLATDTYEYTNLEKFLGTLKGLQRD